MPKKKKSGWDSHHTRITIYIPLEIKKQIEIEMVKRDISQSRVVIDALESYFKKKK